VRDRKRSRERLIALLRGDDPGMLGSFRAPDEPILRTGEVAMLFRVTGRAVRAWADTGKLSCLRTPGGHRLFLASDVREALKAMERGRPTADFGRERSWS
jgi:excisionase family DNA binding protein